MSSTPSAAASADELYTLLQHAAEDPDAARYRTSRTCSLCASPHSTLAHMLAVQRFIDMHTLDASALLRDADAREPPPLMLAARAHALIDDYCARHNPDAARSLTQDVLVQMVQLASDEWGQRAHDVYASPANECLYSVRFTNFARVSSHDDAQWFDNMSALHAAGACPSSQGVHALLCQLASVGYLQSFEYVRTLMAPQAGYIMDGHTLTPLHFAAQRMQADMCVHLLNVGYKNTQRSPDGLTAVGLLLSTHTSDAAPLCDALRTLLAHTERGRAAQLLLNSGVYDVAGYPPAAHAMRAHVGYGLCHTRVRALASSHWWRAVYASYVYSTSTDVPVSAQRWRAIIAMGAAVGVYPYVWRWCVLQRMSMCDSVARIPVHDALDAHVHGVYIPDPLRVTGDVRSAARFAVAVDVCHCARGMPARRKAYEAVAADKYGETETDGVETASARAVGAAWRAEAVELLSVGRSALMCAWAWRRRVHALRRSADRR